MNVCTVCAQSFTSYTCTVCYPNANNMTLLDWLAFDETDVTLGHGCAPSIDDEALCVASLSSASTASTASPLPQEAITAVPAALAAASVDNEMSTATTSAPVPRPGRVAAVTGSCSKPKGRQTSKTRNKARQHLWLFLTPPPPRQSQPDPPPTPTQIYSSWDRAAPIDEQSLLTADVNDVTSSSAQLSDDDLADIIKLIPDC